MARQWHNQLQWNRNNSELSCNLIRSISSICIANKLKFPTVVNLSQNFYYHYDYYYKQARREPQGGPGKHSRRGANTPDIFAGPLWGEICEFFFSKWCILMYFFHFRATAGPPKYCRAWGSLLFLPHPLDGPDYRPCICCRAWQVFSGGWCKWWATTTTTTTTDTSTTMNTTTTIDGRRAVEPWVCCRARRVFPSG